MERLKLSSGPLSSLTTTTMSMIRVVRRLPDPREPTRPRLLNTDGPDEASPSIAESSEQTLFPTTASPSSLPDLGDGRLTVVDISKFTAVKIFDKQSGPSGVEYECEVGRMWLAANSVEKVSGGRVRIRTYEDGLIRERRRGTLRPNKRKHSEI